MKRKMDIMDRERLQWHRRAMAVEQAQPCRVAPCNGFGMRDRRNTEKEVDGYTYCNIRRRRGNYRTDWFWM